MKLFENPPGGFELESHIYPYIPPWIIRHMLVHHRTIN